MKFLKFIFKKQFSWVEFLGISMAFFLYTTVGLWGLSLLLVIVVAQRIGEAVLEDIK